MLDQGSAVLTLDRLHRQRQLRVRGRRDRQHPVRDRDAHRRDRGGQHPERRRHTLSDIVSASAVTGTYNLIGTGGSGGITGGSGGNIVLTGSETAGLSPLGDYGGPTQTMALLPGSPAIGAGIATDSRARAPGHHRPARVRPTRTDPDIGAFQTNPLVVNTTIDGTGSPSGDLSLRQASTWPMCSARPRRSRSARRLRHGADDHARRRPARAERHRRDADDHRSGGGRDDQRRRQEPRVPGQSGVTASLSGLTISGRLGDRPGPPAGGVLQ